jgi:hypothetical protein
VTRHGTENPLPASIYTGWDIHGSDAEYLTIADAHVHPLPEGFSDAELARCCAPGSSATGPCCARRSHRAGIWASGDSAGRQTWRRRSRWRAAPGVATGFLTLARRLADQGHHHRLQLRSADQALADMAAERSTAPPFCRHKQFGLS